MNDLYDDYVFAGADLTTGPDERCVLRMIAVPLISPVNHIQDRARWHAMRTWQNDQHINERRRDYLVDKMMWTFSNWPKPPPAVERSTAAWGSKGCDNIIRP